MIRRTLKILTDQLIYVLALGFHYIIKYIVPVRLASLIGYILGYTLFFYFPISRKSIILDNIKKAFPDKNDKDCLKIYRKSCANFVQLLFETPKTEQLSKNKNLFEIIDKNKVLENLDQKKLLFFSAHMASWFTFVIPFLKVHNFRTSRKTPTNKYFIKIMKKIMLLGSKGVIYNIIDLNRKNMIYISQKFKTKNNNLSFGMLADQKVREGLDNVTFFGRKAYTSHFLPMLSIKYEIPLIPVRIIRNPFFSNKPMITLIIESPISVEKNSDSKENIRKLTQKMNDTIEQWVREYPEQWFWLHRRWQD